MPVDTAVKNEPQDDQSPDPQVDNITHVMIKQTTNTTAAGGSAMALLDNVLDEVNASDDDEIDSPDPRMKSKLKKAKSTGQPSNLEPQMINTEGLRAINKSNSVVVGANKAQRFDR